MQQLYPLSFNSSFLSKIWGGQKLMPLFSNFDAANNIGEVWLISAVPGFESTVKNGFLSGNNINELAEIYMGDLLGDSVFDRFGSNFPLLIKILDTSDWLSLQVHPDDDLALSLHNLPNGKTEMWYILEGGENGEIISGFNGLYDKEKLRIALDNNAVSNFLQSYRVRKGDLFFTPAGMIHAIGPNVTLIEIQQSSDITYRLSDWGRKDINGNSRELHVKNGLDALKFEFEKAGKINYSQPNNGSSNLISCPQFNVNLIKLSRGVLIEKDIFPIDSFIIYVCVEGSAKIITENGTESISFGELLLIPAIFNDLQIVAVEDAVLLETYIK